MYNKPVAYSRPTVQRYLLSWWKDPIILLLPLHRRHLPAVTVRLHVANQGQDVEEGEAESVERAENPILDFSIFKGWVRNYLEELVLCFIVTLLLYS